jgi:diguanylate cyclase (GGDEF)-like protein/PAS domain S-box-containing protein
MMRLFKHWFASPVFDGDEEKTYQAGLLNIITATTLFFVTLVILGNLLGGRTQSAILAIDAVMLVGVLQVRYWLRKGRVKLAGNVFLVSFFILVTGANASLGTIRTPSTAVYLFVVVTAGVLFGMRGIITYTVACSLAVSGLIWAENTGLLPQPDYAVTITQWMTYTALFGFSGGMTYIIHNATRKALAQTRTEIEERKQAEKSLQDSQILLRALTESTRQSFILMDKDARILSFNRVAARNARVVFGNEIQEGASMLDFILEHKREGFSAYFNQALNGEVVAVEETSPSFVWRDHWISFTYNPVHDENDEIIGVCLNALDVTERKLAEDALQNSERRLQALIANGLDYISLLDVEGNLLWESPSSTSILGYRFNEFLGRSIFETMHPEDKIWVLPQFAAIVSEPGSRRPGTFRLRRADGSYRWIEAIVSNFLHDPAVGAIVVNYRDVTERKQAEDENTKLRNAVEQSMDVVFITDGNGVIEYVNPAFETVTGYSRAEVFGRKPNVLKSGLMAEEYYQELWDTILKGDVFHAEVLNRRKNGEIFYYDQTITSIKDLNGNINHFISAGKDVSERKRNESLLQMRLQLLEIAAESLLEDFMQKALDEIAFFTGSSIGFYHFIQPDQKTLSLQAWSARTLKEFCKADGKDRHYDLDQAGVWVDCIRTDQPIIHNDYASLPNRKGLPPGHAEVIRELVVPVRRGGKIVSILGVGNKNIDYTESDVRVVSYLADVVWEIVNRKQTEQILNEIQSRLRLLGDNLEEAALYVYSHDVEGQPHFEYVSAGMEKLTGVKPEDAIHDAANILSLILPEYIPRLIELETKSKEDIVGFEMEVQQRHAVTGEIHWVLLRSTPRRRADGSTVWYGVQMDITQRKHDQKLLEEANEQLHIKVEEIEKLQEELREQAIRDPLTGLYNRRYMKEAFAREFSRAEREGYPVSIIMLDMDDLKIFNDTYGHHIGDLAIQTLATRIQNMTRAEDIVCRYASGDEFAIILSKTTPDDALKRVDEWRRSLTERALKVDGKNIAVKFTAGIAGFPMHGDSVDEVINYADVALYRAKVQGRGRALVFDGGGNL